MPTLYKPKKKYVRENINNRAERNEIYNTNKWRKLRNATFLQQPLCRVCELEGKITPTEDIHHLISLLSTNDPNLRRKIAFDPYNLIGVCKKCHNRIHNSDLQGCYSLEDIEKRINDNKKDK